MTPVQLRYWRRPSGARSCCGPWPMAIDVTIPGATNTSTRDAQVPPHGLCWDARIFMASENRMPAVPGSPKVSISSSMVTRWASAPYLPRMISPLRASRPSGRRSRGRGRRTGDLGDPERCIVARREHPVEPGVLAQCAAARAQAVAAAREHELVRRRRRVVHDREGSGRRPCSWTDRQQRGCACGDT